MSDAGAAGAPLPHHAYLAALVAAAAAALGEDLLGVYAGGSLALGGFEPGSSDIDVAVVARAPTVAAQHEALVDAVRHDRLPCPARKLELVLYRRAAVARPTADPAFDLNVNTGAEEPLLAATDAATVGGFWFAIDRDILARHGIALHGPPAAEVFAPLPRESLTQLMLESLRWHAEHPAEYHDARGNAARAWRWAEEGEWTTKHAALAWARERTEAELDAAALRARAEQALRRPSPPEARAPAARRGTPRAAG